MEDWVQLFATSAFTTRLLLPVRFKKEAHWIARRMKKLMSTVYKEFGQSNGTFVKDIQFFVNAELIHRLSVIQLVSFLEETHVSSE